MIDLKNIDYQKYVDELIDKIGDLVRVRSVYDSDSATKEKPYGEGIDEALALITDWASEDNFEVTNYNGHAILIERKDANKSAERIDFVSHIDVVGEGSNWSYLAFDAVIEDGRMYGRGTNDMKRAVVLTYFVLRIIQDYSIPMKNRLCLVYGTDEETNMQDLQHYLEVEGAPEFAVTPDATFPLGIGEKGATTWLMTGEMPKDSAFINIKGGEGANNVPSICKVTVPMIDYSKIQQYRRQTGWNIEMAPMNDGIQITVKGKSAHASRPDLGENAIILALTLVRDVYDDAFSGNLVELFGYSDGRGLDISCSSPEMGPLTINLGTIKIINQQIVMELDSRFPQVTTSDSITEKIKERLNDHFEITRPFDTPAILYNLDGTACKTLMKQFKEHYPNHSQEPELMGGVTYAKIVPNCVAFGMDFQGQPMLAHQADEYIELDNLKELLQFYTELAVELGNLESLK